MATSTVPTLKANLKTQLAARGGLTGVQIVYGPPSVGMQREYIWLGDADGEQVFAAMGTLNHEEYDLQVIVDVIREGEDEQAADARAFAIQAELENQLRSDNTVNGAVSSAQIGRFKLTENVTADGMTRTARLVTLIHCQAYI
jgi:uncharacterized protein YrzB (UPF0473 family)